MSIWDGPWGGWLTNFSRETKKCTSLVISIGVESALKIRALKIRSAFKTLPSSYGPLIWIPLTKMNLNLALDLSPTWAGFCFQSVLRTLNSELFLHSKTMHLPVTASTMQGLKHVWALLPSCWREKQTTGNNVLQHEEHHL